VRKKSIEKFHFNIPYRTLQMNNPLLSNIILNKHPMLKHLRIDNTTSDISASDNLGQSIDLQKIDPSIGPSIGQNANKSVLINGFAHTMIDKKDLVMRKLTAFYEEDDNLTRMLDVVEGRSHISLRLLDWLITNYAKKNDIIYCIEKNGAQRQFMIYSNYRAQLKAYSKNLFDPFCRHERIKFTYGDNQVLRTTIGQLNFFKWCIENLVLDYAESHFEEITEDMKERGRVTYSTDDTNAKKKELSISATKTISTHDVKIIVSFD